MSYPAFGTLLFRRDVDGRFRQLWRLLDDLGEQIGAEVEALQRSHDEVAADAAFAWEAMENGDQPKLMSVKVDALAAAMMWRSRRITALEAQRAFVNDARTRLQSCWPDRCDDENDAASH
jgi:hypothetical protein